jgi:hypothetical protein
MKTSYALEDTKPLELWGRVVRRETCEGLADLDEVDLLGRDSLLDENRYRVVLDTERGPEAGKDAGTGRGFDAHGAIFERGEHRSVRVHHREFPARRASDEKSGRALEVRTVG